MLAQPAVSEDAILDFLGPHQPKNLASAPVSEPSLAKPAVEGPVPPKKSCGRCNQEISAETHVCPYCHTYVGGGRLR